MKLRHLLIGAMWINFLSATATAETTVVRSPTCVAPADAPLIIDLGEVDAETLGPRMAEAASIFVIAAPKPRGWASAYLLARYDLKDAPTDPDCMGPVQHSSR